MKKYIKIQDLSLRENRILEFRVSCSKNVQKYFLSPTVYMEYDIDISKVPLSILYIPAISSVIMLAWHVGADVYVEELDKVYLNSLGKIKTVMRNWYPRLPFSEIYVDKIVSNRTLGQGYGMLFSGGFDSMATYVRHRDKKPNLIHCFVRDELLKTSRRHLINFADSENVGINFVKTNINDVIDERLLTAQFGVSWFAQINHGTLFTGLCAPLTVGSNIGTLLIASTYTHEFEYPWGSHPLIDNNISWNGCNTIHDGFELSRQQKIRLLKDYVESHNGQIVWDTLVIIPDHCFSDSGSIRQAKDVCGKCEACLHSKGEKCLYNITGLVLENIDPNKCGFNVDNEFFYFIKRSFIKNTLYKRKLLIQTEGAVISHEQELFFWKDIKKNLPETVDNGLHNSEEFFKWLRNFDIEGYKARVKVSQLPRLLVATLSFKLYSFYCSLPANIKNASLLKRLIDFVYKRIS